MSVAKKTILDCHAVCKEINDDYYIALCHAIGQWLSSVHVETHAIDLVFYELNTVVVKNKDNYKNELDAKIKNYISTLYYFKII